MPDYRRAHVPGATYYFTVNLLERYPNDLLVRHIELLRDAVRKVRQAYPFRVDAWVVLPDHMHCLWTLPPEDADFPLRWRLIKSGFSRRLPRIERRSMVRQQRSERGIWQRRYWEHVIRDERDLQAHVDYIHFNPVKHGHVAQVVDWPYSSFHRYVARGMCPPDWAGGADDLEQVRE